MVPAYCITDVREITVNESILESCVSTSSCIPSEKYSSCLSSLRVANGRTATERRSGVAGSDAAVASLPVSPAEPSAKPGPVAGPKNSQPVTRSPHSARAATPPPSALRQVNNWRGAPAVLFAPTDPTVSESDSASGFPPRPCRYAVAPTIGSPMISRIRARLNTQDGRPEFCTRTSTTCSTTQEPAAYRPSAFHREFLCAVSGIESESEEVQAR